MQYAIYYLEPLIADCLSKKAISAGHARTRIEELNANLPEVKTKLILDAFASKSKSALKQYLRIHLTILINAVDTLSRELSKEIILKTPSVLKISMLENIQMHCAALIEFLSVTFPQLINEKMPYPEAVSNNHKAQYNARLSSLKNRTTSNELLQALFTLSLESLATEEYKISPFFERKWEAFLTEMENIRQPERLGYEEITCLLIRYGFNAGEIRGLLCRHLDSQLQLLVDPSRQHEWLCFLEKIFTQAALSFPKRFFKDLPKLHCSILKHIRAEIRLLELLKDAGIGEMGNDPFLGSFTVSLSVKQLAFFVFLQVETGILLTRTAKQVHQYFASRFSTIEGGAISEKSFKNAYYSHSAEDILKVIDKLSQMLVIAEESY